MKLTCSIKIKMNYTWQSLKDINQKRLHYNSITVLLFQQRELDSFLHVVVEWANSENSPKKLRLLCHLIFYFVLKTMQASIDPTNNWYFNIHFIFKRLQPLSQNIGSISRIHLKIQELGSQNNSLRTVVPVETYWSIILVLKEGN